MRIRTGTERDAPVIAEAEWATAETPGLLVGQPGEIPVEAFVSKIVALAPQGSYWVVEDAGEVIGHAFLEAMPMVGNSHVYTLNIVVHPGNTGRGVGGALMTHMLDWAQDHRDLRKIELSVRATNARAIALYRKFGFVEEGRLRARVRTLDGAFVDDLAMAWFRDDN
jgi:RimJ/RimL family protein N-acetyltransferase